MSFVSRAICATPTIGGRWIEEPLCAISAANRKWRGIDAQYIAIELTDRYGNIGRVICRFRRSALRRKSKPRSEIEGTAFTGFALHPEIAMHHAGEPRGNRQS